MVIDAVADAGDRGEAARGALGAQPAAEPLAGPGHFAYEVMSGLKAAANRLHHPFQPAGIEQALSDVEAFEVSIESTPWADVRRAWALARQSLRYSDAVYVAAAERHKTALLTVDGRIARSGASIQCQVITVDPADGLTVHGYPSSTPTQR